MILPAQFAVAAEEDFTDTYRAAVLPIIPLSFHPYFSEIFVSYSVQQSPQIAFLPSCHTNELGHMVPLFHNPSHLVRDQEGIHCTQRYGRPWGHLCATEHRHSDTQVLGFYSLIRMTVHVEPRP